jgi:hypothetical protein
MSCRSCESDSQQEFGSEIIIHHSGLKNLHKPTVWTFPKLLICLDCGFAECVVRLTGYISSDKMAEHLRARVL